VSCLQAASASWVIERTTSIKIAHQDIVPRCSAAHRDGTSRAVASFGPYLIRAAGRGLLDAAKDLLFVAATILLELLEQSINDSLDLRVPVTCIVHACA
jgi:hypothetical protein